MNYINVYELSFWSTLVTESRGRVEALLWKDLWHVTNIIRTTLVNLDSIITRTRHQTHFKRKYGVEPCRELKQQFHTQGHTPSLPLSQNGNLKLFFIDKTRENISNPSKKSKNKWLQSAGSR